jgi:hypothetical protein
MARAVSVRFAPASPAVAPPGSTDDAMVDLWLGRYTRSVHTRRGYATDIRAFRSFVGRPLREVTGADVNAFAAPVLLTPSLWSRLRALRGNARPDDPVFRSQHGGPLDPSQVHRIMKTVALQAKLPSDISVHGLRHAHASHALDRGCPVHVVQTTLGHASLSTTTRYSHARPGDSSARYVNA